MQVAALKGTNAYDYYRALVSRLLKGGRASVLQEPELPDMEELLANVEDDGDLDLWVYSYTSSLVDLHDHYLLLLSYTRLLVFPPPISRQYLS